MEGYIKPLFRELKVYDKRKDAERSAFQKLYEKLIGGLSSLLENRTPRREVATETTVHGELDGGATKISTGEALVNLVRNAFSVRSCRGSMPKYAEVAADERGRKRGRMLWSDVVRVLVALLIGGAIGAEREYRNKAAGLRTMALIGMGSAVFTILSLRLGGSASTDRIASNIVTGIGFLGAGVIFKDGVTISGLTTATTIWATAALGMAVGAGEFWLSAVGLVLVLAVLGAFQRLQDLIDRLRQRRAYKFQFSTEHLSPPELERRLHEFRVHFTLRKVTREGATISCWYDVWGNAHAFGALSDFCLNSPELLSAEYW